MKIRIVTDSGSDLSDEEISNLGILIVPLSIRFGEEELIDRIELGADEFYDRMSNSDDVPQTAAPSPGAFITAFEECFEQGAETVICINMSGELSATIQAAETAARELAGKDIHIFDSKSVTSGLGTMVLEAAKASKENHSVDEILKLVDDLRSKTHVYAAIDTLENLKKGGRIGNAQALLGSMLSIKPLIDVSSGIVEEAGRQRTRKKSLLWLRDKLAEFDGNIENLVVMHARAEDLDEFLKTLESSIDQTEMRVSALGPVVASHGGPGVIGISFTLKN
ncbi:MAG: DegV family protein [Acidimicrobiales bacterium]|nr:DegV family protein [Acidimicrobiales bacterium]